MLNKGLSILILVFGLCLSNPVAAQNRGNAIQGWVKAMGQLWLRANPDDRAILFRKVWHHRSINPEAIQKAAQSLAQKERKRDLRSFYMVLAAPVAKEDPFEKTTTMSLDALLEQSDRGSALVQAVRYSQFLQALDRGKDSHSVVLKRLGKKHKRHPWLKVQKRVLKVERRWNSLRGMLQAIPKPINMNSLKRCRFTAEITEEGAMVLSGWLCQSKSAKFACYGDDLSLYKYQDPPTFVELSFETDLLLKLSVPIKKKDDSGLSLTTPTLSLPTTTLILAYYAECLGRRSLALRIFEYAERAFKAMKIEGSLQQLARNQICERLWRRCAGHLIRGEWSLALPLAERVKKHLKGGSHYESCADFVPGLRSMVKETRPPGGNDIKSRLKRAVYDLRNTRSQQWGMPGGIQLSKGGAMGTFVEIGWDAIPTLIELIGDSRPTRVHSRWRAWSPPFIYDHGSLAESAFKRVVGVDISKLVDLRMPEVENKSLKEKARLWWTKKGKFGRVQCTLEILNSKDRKELGGMIDKILLDSKLRGEAKPGLCRIYRQEKDQELRRLWLQILGSYTDLGLEPDIHGELKSDDFRMAIVAANLLHEFYKNSSGILVVESRLEKLLKVVKADEEEVEGALEYLQKTKSKRLLDLIEGFAKKSPEHDAVLFNLLKNEKDSAQSRRVFVLLMRRPRTDQNSSRSHGDGRVYYNMELKDEVTLFIAERLGMDEKSVFPVPQCEQGKGRDLRIEAIIKKFKLD